MKPWRSCRRQEEGGKKLLKAVGSGKFFCDKSQKNHGGEGGETMVF